MCENVKNQGQTPVHCILNFSYFVTNLVSKMLEHDQESSNKVEKHLGKGRKALWCKRKKECLLLYGSLIDLQIHCFCIFYTIKPFLFFLKAFCNFAAGLYITAALLIHRMHQTRTQLPSCNCQYITPSILSLVLHPDVMQSTAVLKKILGESFKLILYAIPKSTLSSKSNRHS